MKNIYQLEENVLERIIISSWNSFTIFFIWIFHLYFLSYYLEFLTFSSAFFPYFLVSKNPIIVNIRELKFYFSPFFFLFMLTFLWFLFHFSPSFLSFLHFFLIKLSFYYCLNYHFGYCLAHYFSYSFSHYHSYCQTD